MSFPLLLLAAVVFPAAASFARFDCNSGTFYNTVASATEKPSQAVCCMTNPCADFKCNSTTVLKSYISPETEAASQEVCCGAKSCSNSIKCTGSKTFNYSAVSLRGDDVTEAKCCKTQTPSCQFAGDKGTSLTIQGSTYSPFKCKEGTYFKSESSQAEPSQDNCCGESTCDKFTTNEVFLAIPYPCSGDQTYNTSTEGLKDPSNDKCCYTPNKTCSMHSFISGNAVPYQCPEGKVFDVSKSSSTTLSDDACCKTETCGSVKKTCKDLCTDLYTVKAGVDENLQASGDVCCQLANSNSDFSAASTQQVSFAAAVVALGAFLLL